jgi:hypothetical protein
VRLKIIMCGVKKNPLDRIFSTEFVEKNRVFPYTKIACKKRVFNIDDAAKPLKSK